jgi:hypothetical protein
MTRRRKRNGAWGYSAMESDPAYDWMGTVLSPVVIQIDEALRLPLTGQVVHHNAAVLRTAAYLLELIGYEGVYPSAAGLASRFDTTSVLKEHLHLAIEQLEKLAANQEYAASWDDQTKLHAAIMEQVHALRERLADPSAPRSHTLMEVLQSVPAIRKKLLR